jgi:type VI protein secretion system component VasK
MAMVAATTVVGPAMEAEGGAAWAAIMAWAIVIGWAAAMALATFTACGPSAAAGGRAADLETAGNG